MSRRCRKNKAPLCDLLSGGERTEGGYGALFVVLPEIAVCIMSSLTFAGGLLTPAHLAGSCWRTGGDERARCAEGKKKARV